MTLGAGEYVFGTSLGNMRSQEPVPSTLHVFPPQLTDTCNDGTTIIGRGYSTQIDSKCKCPDSMSVADLTAAGIPSAQAAAMRNMSAAVSTESTLVQFIQQDGDTVVVVTILTGTEVCDGLNTTNARHPVCQTVFSNHVNAVVEARYADSYFNNTVSCPSSYMTDGTPASIALQRVDVRETLDAGDISWISSSLQYYAGGNLATIPLKQAFPGATPSALWWTTANMQKVLPENLDAGLETTYAMMNRAAMQRGLTTDAERCIQNVEVTTQSTVHITFIGYVFGVIFCIGMLATNVFGFLLASPWFFAEAPMYPAIRLVSDPTYFSFMTIEHYKKCAGGLTQAEDMMELWPKLDKTVRVGESINTTEDPEYGKIVIDEPSKVTAFILDKQYA